jgi:hypothetical protein
MASIQRPLITPAANKDSLSFTAYTQKLTKTIRPELAFRHLYGDDETSVWLDSARVSHGEIILDLLVSSQAFGIGKRPAKPI